jgi:ATP-dependent Lon protease
MNRGEFVAAISEQSGLTKADADRAIEAMFKVVKKALKGGDSISLVGFGTFVVRKDGPSAGVTMVTALVSALMKVPVRRDLAMTGEITLRGRVLPIGGLKEKLLAAHRGGITTVIIPEENRKDLTEIPKNVTESLDIRPVRWIDEVLDIALERPLSPVARGEGDNVRTREERPVETPARPH